MNAGPMTENAQFVRDAMKHRPRLGQGYQRFSLLFEMQRAKAVFGHLDSETAIPEHEVRLRRELKTAQEEIQGLKRACRERRGESKALRNRHWKLREIVEDEIELAHAEIGEAAGGAIAGWPSLCKGTRI